MEMDTQRFTTKQVQQGEPQAGGIMPAFFKEVTL